ncbi:cation:proton antiporter [Caulobacter sp. KR2-114]|uniref:cation:proton antiporter domain-containing protein n=1 Tax=Caulobacter sp. KR2-114 TaxID=3400912 RepID=UPI003C0B8609
MAAPVHTDSYKDVVLFLATAGVVVPLFKRLKLSPILGFMLAGVALGPSGLGAFTGTVPWLAYLTVSRPGEIAEIAELGVVFLLFMIGLELSWERLRLMRRLVFGLGGAQVLTCLGLAAAAAYALGASWPAALVLGAALALSSTALVMPALVEQRRQHGEGGRAIFAVLLFQDLAVAPMLVTLSLASSGAATDVRHLLLAFAPSAVGLAALVAIGRLALRPLLKSVARAKSSELFMAACLLVVIGAGLISAISGLSMALGAFVAGLLLAETEFRHEVEVIIEPFKGLLLGLFFVSLGINLDLGVLARQPALVLGAAAGLIALKAVAVTGLARLFGLKTPAALETGLALAAGGEFAFVILNQALGAGVVPAGLGAAMLVAATLTMFVSPVLTALGARLGATHRPAASEAAAPPAPDGAARVLIVGFGRVGRLVAEMLDRHEIPWLAVERDMRLVDGARHDGRDVYFGDASRPELLHKLGLEQARALVCTMDAPEVAEAVTAAARGLRPDLTLVVRARDARHARRLYDLGATDAVPETVEASLQLSEATLVDIGVPMGLVIASIHEKRDEFRKALNRPEALGGRRKLRDAGKG